jgi:hypothetical protein
VGTNFLFFIVLYLFLSISLVTSSNAQNLNIKLLESKYPEISKKLNSLKKEATTKESNKAIYLFISESLPLETIERFILESSITSSYFNTKTVLVLQGITKKSFLKSLKLLIKKLEEYENSAEFISNINILIDPKIFKTLKIEKVPAYAFANYTSDFYPSDADMRYIVRGTTTLKEFFKKISQEEVEYESYTELLSSF